MVYEIIIDSARTVNIGNRYTGSRETLYRVCHTHGQPKITTKLTKQINLGLTNIYSARESNLCLAFYMATVRPLKQLIDYITVLEKIYLPVDSGEVKTLDR